MVLGILIGHKGGAYLEDGSNHDGLQVTWYVCFPIRWWNEAALMDEET